MSKRRSKISKKSQILLRPAIQIPSFSTAPSRSNSQRSDQGIKRLPLALHLPPSPPLRPRFLVHLSWQGMGASPPRLEWQDRFRNRHLDRRPHDSFRPLLAQAKPSRFPPRFPLSPVLCFGFGVGFVARKGCYLYIYIYLYIVIINNNLLWKHVINWFPFMPSTVAKLPRVALLFFLFYI